MDVPFCLCKEDLEALPTDEDMLFHGVVLQVLPAPKPFQALCAAEVLFLFCPPALPFVSFALFVPAFPVSPLFILAAVAPARQAGVHHASFSHDPSVCQL